MQKIRRKFVRLSASGASLLFLAGCLTDQQLTSIYASALSSGLSALVNVFISGLAGDPTTGG